VLSDRLEVGRLHEAEALRYLRIGEPERAGTLAKGAVEGLRATGEGQALAVDSAAPGKVEIASRLDALGRLMDAAALGAGPSARPVLRNVMDKRLSAVNAFVKADYGGSAKALDEAAALLAGVAPVHASQLAEVWKLERDLASGQARYEALTWTRPMLTMSEQLSLVLMLELAFGVIFELPLVMALLAVVGLVKSSWLMRYQRHAFVVCLVSAALLTPTGDAINLALMAVPMLLCFEIGVVAVWLIERRRARDADETAITPAS
jgi:sec-independent protein translocase protein TatC